MVATFDSSAVAFVRSLKLLALASISLVAVDASAQNKCSATVVIAGQKASLANCIAAFLDDSNSVTIWFNEAPVAPKEAEAFQVSAYADTSKDGKERTMVLIAFCPGGGKPTAAAAAVKSIDMGIGSARSALAGRQWVIDAGKDFKVERLSGEVKAGGTLAGRITGSRSSDGPYSWDLEFDVRLPAKSAAAGMSCGK
ncbi:MAG: hypothetical protein ABI886_00525 [Betaproteobacteria bacterium]